MKNLSCIILFAFFLHAEPIHRDTADIRVIARIADDHLDQTARKGLYELFGNETLVNLALKLDAKPDVTDFQWNYLCVPYGLRFYWDFSKAVDSQGKQNLYLLIDRQIQVLKNRNSTKVQQKTAISNLLLLIGAAFQPMQIGFEKSDSNNVLMISKENLTDSLKHYFDDRWIKDYGKDFLAKADSIDYLISDQYKTLVVLDPMEWLWESYQVSSYIYHGKLPSGRPDGIYDKNSGAIIANRLDMAGLRLAGVLNTIFTPLDSIRATTERPDPIADALGFYPLEITRQVPDEFIGSRMALICRIYGIRNLGNKTELYMGATYPHQLFTVILGDNARKLAISNVGKKVKVTGTIHVKNGRKIMNINKADHFTLDTLIK